MGTLHIVDLVDHVDISIQVPSAPVGRVTLTGVVAEAVIVCLDGGSERVDVAAPTSVVAGEAGRPTCLALG